MSGGWTSIKSMIDIIDEALISMQNFPYGVLYESLCRQKAMLLLEDGKEDEAIAYLTESFGVTVRQRFVYQTNERRGVDAGRPAKDQKDQLKGNASISGLQRHLLEFGGPLTPDAPLGYKSRLAALPSEWTVVQISELDCGPSQCPPRSAPSHSKPLVVCRLGCGSRAGQREIRLVPSPMPLPYCRDLHLIAELQSILKDNSNISTIGSKEEFWKKKNEIECRFKVVLEALKEWLAELRCLLLGRIASPALETELEKAVGRLAKKLNVPDASVPSLSLLTQAAVCLTDAELQRGLGLLVPVTGEERAKQLRVAALTVLSLAKSVMGQRTESLSFTPRHLVILVLDKTLYGLPWEMLDVLRRQPVSRVPCLALVHAMFAAPQSRRQLDSKSAFFVVDPDNNLSNTAKRMEHLVLARPTWTGTVRKRPSKLEVEQALLEQDVYLYCGHGAGMHLLPQAEKMECTSVAILVGCSSSNINKLGHNWEMHGAPINFMLSGSPATLGMLWDVLDRDADKMTVHLLETWLPPGSQKSSAAYHKKLCEDDLSYKSVLRDVSKPYKELLQALWAARTASDSSFIAAAFVANGLPMSVQCHLSINDK